MTVFACPMPFRDRAPGSEPGLADQYLVPVAFKPCPGRPFHSAPVNEPGFSRAWHGIC